jgi:serine/threonine protein phosphatase PrpC
MDDESANKNRRALFSSVASSDNFEPSSALVRAEFAARSHSGRVFNGNDDHYLVLRLDRQLETLLTSLTTREVPRRFDECAYAAVVADGIGGDGAGAMAARLAISTLVHLERRFGQWTMRIDPEAAAEVMDRSKWFYERTHDAVLRWYRAHIEVGRMSATLSGIYSAGDHLFVAHVGHSRCYLFREGELTQLTRDQTLRERLATSPQPTSIRRGLEDAEHILTNSLGANAKGSGVVVEHFRLTDDDSVILCTNGLTDILSDEQIADTLASRRTPKEQCDQLVDAALARGGNDNVTVVLANYRIPELPEGHATGDHGSRPVRGGGTK